MATATEIATWAAGAEARGVLPHRPIGPPDWQAKGALLSFMLGQGFSNEHEGRLPSSDAEFLTWASAPYVNNPGLRRYWPPGSVDVKTDGSRNPPPWDWAPMGCPGGAGCNDDDWMNHAPWPSPNGAGGAGAAPAAGTGAAVTVVTTPIGAIQQTPSGHVVIPGLGAVSPLVLGAGALALVLLVARRR